jgi:hypothetical protein
MQDAGQLSFEQRIKHPPILILLVIAMMMWGLGLVDLMSHASQDATIFGQYSFGYFLFLLVYTLGFLVFGALLLRPRLLDKALSGVQWIQKRWWIALPLLVMVFGAVGVLANWGRLYRFPGLQFALIVILLLAALVLLFYDWSAAGSQRWRWLVVVPIAILTVLEVGLQLLGNAGLLPSFVQHDAGLFLPYGRLYQSQQGLGNARMNRYGWYYPEFRLAEGEQQIVLIGDEYVQGLQVKPEQNLGVMLDAKISQSDLPDPSEVITLGMPGFGPGLYLETMRYALKYYNPREFIVFVNLATDFQNEFRPHHQYITYERDPAGELQISEWSAPVRHDLQHVVLRSHEYFHALPTLWSNYLTPSFVSGMLKEFSPEATAQAAAAPELAQDAGWREFTRPADLAHVLPADSLRVTWPSNGTLDWNFWDISIHPHTVRNFQLNEGAASSVDITAGILEMLHDEAAAQGATVRVVTLPVFPESFYSDSDRWSADDTGFEPLLPERLLSDRLSAAGIQTLRLGEYLRGSGDVEAIRKLYFENGAGYFTPDGHKFAADLVYRCFYAAEITLPGCMPASSEIPAPTE